MEIRSLDIRLLRTPEAACQSLFLAAEACLAILKKGSEEGHNMGIKEAEISGKGLEKQKYSCIP